MRKCAQGSLVPSYLTNSGALNLGGIMTWGKLVKLSRSMPPWTMEPSMIRSFSTRVSTWLLTWPYLDSGFLSIEGFVSWSLPWGGTLWPYSCIGRGWFSFSVWLWPKEFCPPPTTSCYTMHINFDTCSFRRATSWIVSSWGEVPLVDIFFAWDLVTMGSRRGSSLACFF